MSEHPTDPLHTDHEYPHQKGDGMVTVEQLTQDMTEYPDTYHDGLKPHIDTHITSQLGETGIVMMARADPEQLAPKVVDMLEGNEQVLARLSQSRPLVKEQEHRRVPRRLQFLEKASQITGQDYETDHLDYLEDVAHLYAPSIGLEVELYKKQLLTPSERELSDSDKKLLLRSRLETIKSAHQAGLPLDMSDPWPEFALKPARSAMTVVAELHALKDLDILHIGEVYSPIHVTLGGIKLDGEARNLARAIEASGLSTTAWRLMMPTKGGDFWTTGDSGLHDRRTKDRRSIKGGAMNAVEFRTMHILGENSLKETLLTMQTLGTALSAFQDYSNTLIHKRTIVSTLVNPYQRYKSWVPITREGVDLETQARLATVWINFSNGIRDLFETHDIKDPNKKWREPKKAIISRRGDFGKLADTLNGNNDLAGQVRSLMTLACTEIKNTIAVDDGDAWV